MAGGMSVSRKVYGLPINQGGTAECNFVLGNTKLYYRGLFYLYLRFKSPGSKAAKIFFEFRLECVK